MKKVYFWKMVAVAAVLFTTACEKSNVSPVPTSKSVASDASYILPLYQFDTGKLCTSLSSQDYVGLMWEQGISALSLDPYPLASTVNVKLFMPGYKQSINGVTRFFPGKTYLFDNVPNMISASCPGPGPRIPNSIDTHGIVLNLANAIDPDFYNPYGFPILILAGTYQATVTANPVNGMPSSLQFGESRNGPPSDEAYGEITLGD